MLIKELLQKAIITSNNCFVQ